MKKDISIALVALTVGLFSCNGNNTEKTTITDTSMVTDTSMNAANKMTGNPADNTSVNNPAKTITDSSVTDFVAKAANAGMMEIELGNYATNHAKNQRVKDFGSMMVADHTAANNELKAMAVSNSIPVPATIKEDDKKHIDMMEKKSGADFDKAYIEMMLNGHKKVANEFKEASAMLKVDSYKSFASKTLPVIQKHLDSASAIKKSL